VRAHERAPAACEQSQSRHSIFAQGGFALRPIDAYERNAYFRGHGQHYAARREPPACDRE